jgi:putative transposase
VLHKDVRFTLAVEFVHPDDDLVKITRRLIRRVRALGISVKSYYLDKGFCTIPVLRWLQAQADLVALIAAPIRGKKGGTRGLCQGQRSYRTFHTFRSQKYGQLTVPVAVIRTFRTLKNGRRQAEWLVYVLLNLAEMPLRTIRKRYRRRFGIESSYRLLEQVRGRTTARNPALRFLWMGLALVIGNIWIALHWRYLRRRGSGPRRVARKHFTLAQMAHFLVHAIEAIYGVVTVIDPPDVKPAIL